MAIQSEIAQAIADKLRGNLSVQEKAAIAERPTVDLKTYELYTRAKAIDPWTRPAARSRTLTRRCRS